jgi:hypothetical protein
MEGSCGRLQWSSRRLCCCTRPRLIVPHSSFLVGCYKQAPLFLNLKRNCPMKLLLGLSSGIMQLCLRRGPSSGTGRLHATETQPTFYRNIWPWRIAPRKMEAAFSSEATACSRTVGVSSLHCVPLQVQTDVACSHDLFCVCQLLSSASTRLIHFSSSIHRLRNSKMSCPQIIHEIMFYIFNSLFINLREWQ